MKPTDMVERTVELTIRCPVEEVYALWADLENLPRWMRYIKEVRLDPLRPGHSRWKFGIDPLFVEWSSRITQQIPLRLVAWESVEGLENRGRIDFFPEGPYCRLRLNVAVSAPGGVVGVFIAQVGLGTWIDQNLQADLERFARLAENKP